MNTYQVLERDADHRFDMTRTNDGHAAPCGYCHAYKPIAEDAAWATKEMITQWNAQEAPFASKYHDDGHASKAEAAECYRLYLLDHQLQLGRKTEGVQHHCLICGEWTEGVARLDMESWPLCEEHNNRVEVEKLFNLGPEVLIYSST